MNTPKQLLRMQKLLQKAITAKKSETVLNISFVSQGYEAFVCRILEIMINKRYITTTNDLHEVSWWLRLSDQTCLPRNLLKMHQNLPKQVMDKKS